MRFRARRLRGSSRRGRLVASGNWDEAVDIYDELAADDSDRVVEVAPDHYVSLRTYCNLQLARLPAEGLAAYRRRVDPLAKRLYEDGIAKHDTQQLQRVVDATFCSSWGDDALLAIGELALERADYDGARRALGANQPAAARSTWRIDVARPFRHRSRRELGGDRSPLAIAQWAARLARVSRHDHQFGRYPRPASPRVDSRRSARSRRTGTQSVPALASGCNWQNRRARGFVRSGAGKAVGRSTRMEINRTAQRLADVRRHSNAIAIGGGIGTDASACLGAAD